MIYVDDLYDSDGNEVWCRLFGEDYDAADLREFAREMNLRESWFRWKAVPGMRWITRAEAQPPWLWHYRVPLVTRVLAVRQYGVAEVDKITADRLMANKRARFAALDVLDQRRQRTLWGRVARGLATFPDPERTS